MAAQSTSLSDDSVEIGIWAPAGRQVRTGSWRRQAETTLDRIDAMLEAGRHDDAAALVRHLVVEATEVHELLTKWCARIPEILRREGVPAERITAASDANRATAADMDHQLAWEKFVKAADAAADQIADGRPPPISPVVRAWVEGQDSHVLLTAAWVDTAARELGEERLGDLWAELQHEPIRSYDRYGADRAPWSQSFELLVQIALEGMHAHFGGPRGRGEVELLEHEDRIEMRFDPCGSGGKVRRDTAFGVTSKPYPFAWNRAGVCHYCIHCCVLQQLEPIRRLGYPGRVIDPPTEPGMPCTWTVYRDPALVPDEAYTAVGATPPKRERGSDGTA